jgi:hypothetical protein
MEQMMINQIQQQQRRMGILQHKTILTLLAGMHNQKKAYQLMEEAMLQVKT